MDFKLWGRRLVPHLVVIACFVAAIAFYFSPLVFQGLNIKQSDASQWAGSAQEIALHRKAHNGEEPLWTNGMFAGMPAYTISVIYSGEWIGAVENGLHLGMPYPASILLVSLICYYILMLALGFRPALAALGAVGFTFFTFSMVSIEAGHNSKVRAMAMAPLLLAGIALMFRDKRMLGFAITALGMGLQIHAGHYQVTYYLAMFCVFLGLGYMGLAIQAKKVGAFALQVGLLVLAVAVGVGANAGRLLLLNEYAANSMRGVSELSTKPGQVAGPAKAPGAEVAGGAGGLERDYVFAWSNQIGEAFTLLVPGFRGGSSQEPLVKGGAVERQLRTINVDPSQVPSLPMYWGDQPFTSGPVYAGAVIVILAAIAVAVLPAAQTWWLVAAVLFSIALSWGKHFEAFNFAMYDYFPAYRQFRSVTMAIVIAQWALPWLAVAGLGYLAGVSEGVQGLAHHPEASSPPFMPGPLSKPGTAPTHGEPASKAAGNGMLPIQRKLIRGVQIGGGVVALLLIAFFFIPSMAGDFITPNDAQLPADFKQAIYAALQDDREGLLSSDALRSLAFALLAAGGALAMLRGWAKPSIVLPVIAVLALVDLWGVNRRYLNKDSFQRNFYVDQFQPSPADQRMMQALPYGQYRVLNLQNPFNETKTSYYHQSLGGYSPAKLRRYQDLIMGPLSAEIDSLPSLLGRPSLAGPEAAFAQTPILNMLNAHFIKYGDEADKVLENPLACGPCWMVPAVRRVISPDQEYASLHQNFNPRAEALIDEKKFTFSGDKFDTVGASARLTEYRSNRLTYQVASPRGPGLLVMSENYYPEGWTATIDGKPAQIMRADYTLRAIAIPAGTHEVVCAFAPAAFSLGNTISMISSLLIFGLIGAAGFLAVQKRRKVEAHA